MSNGPLEQGHTDAQHNLGRAYETGMGVAKDVQVALQWYERAAKEGHRIARADFERLLALIMGEEEVPPLASDEDQAPAGAR